ncbi:hypothetical protein [Dokdonella sp.]|uniref:hypothetical protein n=1 Tax=Dokdonella sp. TaxID=2291710 RepID=UPI003C3AD8AF
MISIRIAYCKHLFPAAEGVAHRPIRLTINLTLEQWGDRSSLIAMRDVMFGNRRSYGELLAGSEEGIASHNPQTESNA